MQKIAAETRARRRIVQALLPGAAAAMLVCVFAPGAALAPAPCAAQTAQSAPAGDAATQPALKPFTQRLPVSTATIDMIPIPAGKTRDGRDVGPLFFSRTEIPWEVYDIFAYKMDETNPVDPGTSGPPGGVDAVSRPSKPYLPPDRGFGHAGYPAISLTGHAAAEFCKWLSTKTGRRYRLPTEQEWEYACRAGSAAAWSFGPDAAQLGDYAWFKENARGKPHPVAGKKPNAWQLYDMHGNVGEWVQVADGKFTTCGGSFRDAAEKLRCDARQAQQDSWQVSDPQIPKSIWWLSDCGFIGFRIVCDPEPPARR